MKLSSWFYQFTHRRRRLRQQTTDKGPLRLSELAPLVTFPDKGTQDGIWLKVTITLTMCWRGWMWVWKRISWLHARMLILNWLQTFLRDELHGHGVRSQSHAIGHGQDVGLPIQTVYPDPVQLGHCKHARILMPWRTWTGCCW